MECPICQASNSAAQSYCGACGSPLNATSERLRQQVVEIVKGNFSDQKLAVFEIADQVEKRIQKRSTRGTLALTLVVALLAAYGIKSISDARAKLDSTAQAASKSLDDASKLDGDLLDKKTGTMIGEIQKHAEIAETNLRQINVREKGTDRQLKIAETRAKEYSSRLEVINQLREQSPSTPVGSLQSSLFTPVMPTGVVVTPILEGPLLGETYGVGTTGSKISHLQARLVELGCLKNAQADTLDAATQAAVIEFKRATKVSNPFGSTQLMLTDDETGEVNASTWSNIFSPFAPHCR